MPVIYDTDNALYQPFAYSMEKDFEKVIVALADQIFGPATIYVDVKKKLKGDVVTIPDGYLIDCTEPDDPRLFIIENEIVSHDPFKHIGVQMLKFATSFDDAQGDVRQFLMAAIQKDPQSLQRLEICCGESSSRNIDNYLDQAVYGTFRALVIIDEARPALHKVLEKINADISVLEVKTFKDQKGRVLHLFDTLYDEFADTDAEQRSNGTPLTPYERSLRRAQCVTVVVPAQKEGFQRTFIGENRWYAIRISAAMKGKIKYLATYQVKPISAVTHIAEVEAIKPYKDSGKYMVIFKGPAVEMGPVKIKNPKNAPQGLVYVKREELMNAKNLEQALR